MTDDAPPAPKLIFEIEPFALTGITKRINTLRNTGTGRITLVKAGGERLVIEPGQTVMVPDDAFHEPYRLACDGCGVADGSHESGCVLDQRTVPHEGPL